MSKIALAIHGGAGTILRSQMTPALEAEYRSGLENALRIGWKILEKRGSSLDAVEAAVAALEDFHLFNAGRGSVFTHEGKIELDASIMDGGNLRAGAVAFVTNIKNPVRLARLVMEKSEHVMLAGEGANQFAAEMHVEPANDEYLFTEHRWRQLIEARNDDRVQLDHSKEEGEKGRRGEEETRRQKAETRPVGSVSHSGNPKSKIQNPKSLGTVGAVACDSHGNLAAATSTGGMTNKKFGRVGDTPIIGAGTYAENSTCAVSCTGHGEFFMLGVTAHDLAARMKYKDLSLEKAANEVIDHLTKIGGEGGLIAVDSLGNVTLPFNSEGMYRGFVTADGDFKTEIFR